MRERARGRGRGPEGEGVSGVNGHVALSPHTSTSPHVTSSPSPLQPRLRVYAFPAKLRRRRPAVLHDLDRPRSNVIGLITLQRRTKKNRFRNRRNDHRSFKTTDVQSTPQNAVAAAKASFVLFRTSVDNSYLCGKEEMHRFYMVASFLRVQYLRLNRSELFVTRMKSSHSLAPGRHPRRAANGRHPATASRQQVPSVTTNANDALAQMRDMEYGRLTPFIRPGKSYLLDDDPNEEVPDIVQVFESARAAKKIKETEAEPHKHFGCNVRFEMTTTGITLPGGFRSVPPASQTQSPSYTCGWVALCTALYVAPDPPALDSRKGHC